MATMSTAEKKKTPQAQFIESMLALQAERMQEAERNGTKVSRIRREDLIGLVFVDHELVMIHSKDLEPYNL